MLKRNRRIVLAVAALLLVAAYAVPSPRADIRILAAETTDANPQKLQAAVGIGMVAISVLITWTKRFAD
jgi:hypothetical protein